MAPISCRLLLHPSGIVSPTVQLQQARFLLGVAGLPLTIPSNRNHLCLLHEALSWARIMFGVNDAHLTKSSTRNNHHLLYGVFNRAMITLGVVGLLLTIPSTRNLFFPSMVCSTGSGSYWTLLTSPLIFPSPRNLLLLFHGHFCFLHPAGSFSFPYHPLLLVMELETHPSSLSLAHGQKS